MNLQNMAPNARRSLMISCGLGAVALILWMFALEPSQAALASARNAYSESEERLRIMRNNLADADKVKSNLAAVEDALAPFRNALLEPLLGSLAMRAKSLVDPMAQGAGLTGMQYEDLPVRELPVTRPLARQLYARCPVKIACQGSYAAIASFILRVERDLPLVTLGELAITAQNDPAQQTATITLEWPTRGKETRK